MAIIGISGKIGSGKSTVGEIIQMLTSSKYSDEGNFDDALKYLKNYGIVPLEASPQSPWQIKSFAGKIKEIVALLTGCNVEDLESHDFKNKKLGEEWGDMSYRQMLQKIGTECMRDGLHKDVWVNALFSDYKKPAQIAIEKTGGYCNHPNPVDFPNWIITDLRFPNELKAVEDRGGITIRINRTWQFVHGLKVLTRIAGIEGHPSETALDTAKFKYIVNNDGTIEELIEKIKEILKKENIV